jgi:hypothetical protein
MDTKDYITIRVRKGTQRKLKVVAALAEESMLDTLERLVSQEYDRLHQSQKGKARNAALQKDQT